MNVVPLLDEAAARLKDPQPDCQGAAEALNQIEDRARELASRIEAAGILSPARLSECETGALREAFAKTSAALQEAGGRDLASSTAASLNELSRSLGQAMRALDTELRATQQQYMSALLATDGLGLQDIRARAIVNHGAGRLLLELEHLASLSSGDLILDDAAVSSFEEEVAKLREQVRSLPADEHVEWEDPEAVMRAVEGPGVSLGSLSEADILLLRQHAGDRIILGPADAS